jgi:hypothetical protein
VTDDNLDPIEQAREDRAAALGTQLVTACLREIIRDESDDLASEVEIDLQDEGLCSKAVTWFAIEMAYLCIDVTEVLGGDPEEFWRERALAAAQREDGD